MALFTFKKKSVDSAFDNAMYFAMQANRHPDPLQRLLKLKDLRKVFLRKIQSQHISLCYCSGLHGAPAELDEDAVFGKELAALLMNDYRSEVPQALSLNLANDIVFPTPWHPSRMINNVGVFGIGYGRQEWEQHTNNHEIYWLETFGFGVVGNGNHSITAAIINNDISLFKIPNYIEHGLVFDYVHFDGQQFVLTASEKALGEPVYPEFGIVFEISRLIHQLQNNTGEHDGVY